MGTAKRGPCVFVFGQAVEVGRNRPFAEVHDEVVDIVLANLDSGAYTLPDGEDRDLRDIAIEHADRILS